MNESEILAHAENFLIKKKISFVKPGVIGERNLSQVEVIFLIPEALNPNFVVDPPDVRVWVDVHSGKVFLACQM